jgi:23S rRNA (uridine2552-2'-O)-methyltransferase
MAKPYIPNDKWSQRAAKEGYRARSVYKLMELDDKFGLIKSGMTVIDLGAAPGSWMQYTAKKVGKNGMVYGFDLQEIVPVADNVKTFVMDITDKFALEDALRNEGVREADLVLSDIAPNTSGIKDYDQARSIELAQATIAIASDMLVPGGFFAVKVFRGSDFDEFYRQVKHDWYDVKVVEALATRDSSSEVYVVGRKKRL